MPYTADCEYQLDFRSMEKDKPWCVATIYHPTQDKNKKKIEKFEKDKYKFYKTNKLTIITYKSNKRLNPIFCKYHVPKPMVLTKYYTRFIEILIIL